MKQPNNEQTPDALIKNACEMCENHSTSDKCEDRYGCPVYNLYLMAANRHDSNGHGGSWDTLPTPPSEHGQWGTLPTPPPGIC